MGNNQVVMVTGCSTGIGRDICEIMTNKGYVVVATARNIDSLRGVSAALKLRVDVMDKESINSAVNDVVEKLGKIDISYYDLYKKEIDYMKIQKRTDSKKAASQISNIIIKDKLKARYKVAVPFSFKLLIRFPDSIKEFILLRH